MAGRNGTDYIWYWCRLCHRTFPERHLLVLHKKQNHRKYYSNLKKQGQVQKKIFPKIEMIERVLEKNEHFNNNQFQFVGASVEEICVSKKCDQNQFKAVKNIEKKNQNLEIVEINLDSNVDLETKNVEYQLPKGLVVEPTTMTETNLGVKPKPQVRVEGLRLTKKNKKSAHLNDILERLKSIATQKMTKIQNQKLMNASTTSEVEISSKILLDPRKVNCVTTQLENYVCDECDSKFSSENDLSIHRQKVHLGSRIDLENETISNSDKSDEQSDMEWSENCQKKISNLNEENARSKFKKNYDSKNVTHSNLIVMMKEEEGKLNPDDVLTDVESDNENLNEFSVGNPQENLEDVDASIEMEILYPVEKQDKKQSNFDSVSKAISNSNEIVKVDKDLLVKYISSQILNGWTYYYCTLCRNIFPFYLFAQRHVQEKHLSLISSKKPSPTVGEKDSQTINTESQLDDRILNHLDSKMKQIEFGCSQQKRIKCRRLSKKDIANYLAKTHDKRRDKDLQKEDQIDQSRLDDESMNQERDKIKQSPNQIQENQSEVIITSKESSFVVISNLNAENQNQNTAGDNNIYYRPWLLGNYESKSKTDSYSQANTKLNSTLECESNVNSVSNASSNINSKLRTDSNSNKDPMPNSTEIQTQFDVSNLNSNSNSHEILSRQFIRGKKNFNCNICQQYFDKPSHAFKHLRSHTFRPFNCNDCDMTFRIKGILDIHKNKRHQKSKKLHLQKIQNELEIPNENKVEAAMEIPDENKVEAAMEIFDENLTEVNHNSLTSLVSSSPKSENVTFFLADHESDFNSDSDIGNWTTEESDDETSQLIPSNSKKLIFS